MLDWIFFPIPSWIVQFFFFFFFFTYKNLHFIFFFFYLIGSISLYSCVWMSRADQSRQCYRFLLISYVYISTRSSYSFVEKYCAQFSIIGRIRKRDKRSSICCFLLLLLLFTILTKQLVFYFFLFFILHLTKETIIITKAESESKS